MNVGNSIMRASMRVIIIKTGSSPARQLCGRYATIGRFSTAP